MGSLSTVYGEITGCACGMTHKTLSRFVFPSASRVTLSDDQDRVISVILTEPSHRCAAHLERYLSGDRLPELFPAVGIHNNYVT
jgi:hypothetical protein